MIFKELFFIFFFFFCQVIFQCLMYDRNDWPVFPLCQPSHPIMQVNVESEIIGFCCHFFPPSILSILFSISVFPLCHFFTSNNFSISFNRFFIHSISFASSAIFLVDKDQNSRRWFGQQNSWIFRLGLNSLPHDASLQWSMDIDDFLSVDASMEGCFGCFVVIMSTPLQSNRLGLRIV